MGQTVYAIYEIAADALNAQPHQTRIYMNEDDAKQHVEENHDPMLVRTVVAIESSDTPKVVDSDGNTVE